MCHLRFSIKKTGAAKDEVWATDLYIFFNPMYTLKPAQLHCTCLIAQLGNHPFATVATNQFHAINNTCYLQKLGVGRNFAYFVYRCPVYMTQWKMFQQVAKSENG